MNIYLFEYKGFKASTCYVDPVSNRTLIHYPYILVEKVELPKALTFVKDIYFVMVNLGLLY